MPSIFETDARKEGRKSESTLKSELEEYDPEDPEFDPSDEPPRKAGKSRMFPRASWRNTWKRNRMTAAKSKVKRWRDTVSV